MDLNQQLNHLESHRDWHGVAEALEQAIASTSDVETKADLHLRFGRLLHSRFLQGVKALKHFQDAFKLNPALVDALAEARAIYWELGKLNMVQKLLELQLKGTRDPVTAVELLRQLGDVLTDQGDYERAAEAYGRAVQGAGGQPGEVSRLLEDVQTGEEEWQERVGALLRSAHETADSAARAAAFIPEAQTLFTVKAVTSLGMPA